MATILHFQLSSTTVSTASIDLSASFTPPSSVAGKLCYVQATYFQWENGSTPTTALGSNDCIYVTCDWPQPWATTTTDSGSKVGAPLAFWNNNRSYSGPHLIQMPDNPHVVRFTVTRADGNHLTGSTGTSYMTFCLKANVADGKQPPLGV